MQFTPVLADPPIYSIWARGREREIVCVRVFVCVCGVYECWTKPSRDKKSKPQKAAKITKESTPTTETQNSFLTVNSECWEKKWALERRLIH